MASGSHHDALYQGAIIGGVEYPASEQTCYIKFPCLRMGPSDIILTHTVSTSCKTHTFVHQQEWLHGSHIMDDNTLGPNGSY